MQKSILFATLAALALLPACNTVEGAAEDVKSVGKASKKSAEEVGKKL